MDLADCVMKAIFLAAIFLKLDARSRAFQMLISTDLSQPQH